MRIVGYSARCRTLLATTSIPRIVKFSLTVVALVWVVVAGTQALAQNRMQSQPIPPIKTGHCDADDIFAIAVHGGAIFSDGNHDEKLGFVQNILTDVRRLIAAGARSLDIVEAVIAAMEDSGIFNAGKGAIANKSGVVELDASIMDGRFHKAGAVASTKAVRNPIRAARMVMERTPHVMLVGPDADSFVQREGGKVVDSSYWLYGGRNFQNVPLPTKLLINSVVAPGSTMAPKRFLGAWGGVWVGSLNHVLVVEKIAANRAAIVFALGPGSSTGEGYYKRTQASYKSGQLSLIERNKGGDWAIRYRWTAGDVLAANATERSSGRTYRTYLRRIKLPRGDHDGGTVGAVARDRCGDLAAATSTGGFGSKLPGRVGDSPIIGAGTYASNETAAISATGHGELFMRYVAAHEIAAAMKYGGLSLQKATRQIIERELFQKGLRGGVIAVDRFGRVAVSFNTKGMVRGFTTNSAKPEATAY